MPRPDALPAWHQLAAHRQAMQGWSLAAALAAEPSRTERLWLEAGPLAADLSRHLIDDTALRLLAELAEQAGVQTRFARLCRGDVVNPTEGRPALHVALRGEWPVLVGGRDLRPELDASREQQRDFANRVRDGGSRGSTGEAIRDVVNLGIGGSDLGPALALDALAGHADGPRCHCVSDLDDAQLDDVLAGCEPATTLFIVCSKTFGTLETLRNARRAREWLAAGGLSGDGLRRHFAAVTTQPQRAVQWGVDAERCFALPEGIGGRYSIWSAVSLVVQIACGPAVVDAMNEGAAQIDRHFAECEPERNLPLLLGLLGVWYRNFHGAQTHAVLPYSHRLQRLPAYLQQLEMESLGKHIDLDGEPVAWDTGGVLFGASGPHAQHAFMQLLHQGTLTVPVDLVLTADSQASNPDLNANALAQAAVLAGGGTVAAAPGRHGELPGGRPSTTLILPRLDAASLGALLATYEHKVFTQATVWHINPFDQWGVEQGKTVAGAISRGEPPQDASLQAVLEKLKNI